MSGTANPPIIYTDFTGKVYKEDWNDFVRFVPTNTTVVNSNYSASNTDGLIIASGTIDVTLPSPVGIEGKIIYIKNTGPNIVTVKSDSIDGLTAQNIFVDECIEVQSDNTVWYII